MPEPLMTIPGAAPLLRLSTRRAYALALEGRLPGLRRLGARRVFVARHELEQFLGGPVPATAGPLEEEAP